jgi:hypothetical protein
MGWRQVQGKGEVWLVLPTPQSEVVEIPVGSCSLTDDVQIQVSDIRNRMWQLAASSPFFERDLSGKTDWMMWSTYDVVMTYSELDSLLLKLGKDEDTEKDLDYGVMLARKRQIEICPIGMRAMSRRAEIVGMVRKADAPNAVTLCTKFVA